MADSGNMTVDRRVSPWGRAMTGEVRLPDLDGVPTTTDTPRERIGYLVMGNVPLFAGAALAGLVAGGAIGFAKGPSNLLGRIATAAGGALLGSAGLLAASAAACAAVGRLSGSTDPARGVPTATDGPQTAPDAQPETLRLMDWNVHGLAGPHDAVRTNDDGVNAIKRAVAEQHPDVLVLQEVTAVGLPGTGQWPHSDVEELARELGATSAVFVPNRVYPGYQRGGAVLTFNGTHIADARALHHGDLPGGGYFPRSSSDVMLVTPAGNAVRLLGVHLSGTGGPTTTGGTPGSTGATDAQLGPLLNTVDAWDGETILAGDFNVASGSDVAAHEAALASAAGLTDAFTQVGVAADDPARHSFPAWAPSKGIDHVYTSAGIAASNTRVVDVEDGSDHRPVVTTLRIG